MPDMSDPQHRKRMLPSVVAEMVAKGPLRLRGTGLDRALDHEVGVGRDRGAAVTANHRDAVAREHPRKGELREAFRQRHHGRHRHRRGAAHEDRDLERHALFQCRRMMHADPAMKLVMETGLEVVFVSVASQLHSIHAEV